MRIKFIAVWGLLMSSTIGSPIAQPKPIPKPAPLPIPREGPYQGISGGLMGLEPKDKIALAALLTGTVLTIVNKIYDQWMARKTFHYNLSKEGTAMQVRSLENYIAALERTGSPGVEKMARAFRNQLLLIRNHYGSRLTHHWGLSGVSRTYQEMSQAVSNLLEDVKEVHDEANQPHQHLIDMDKKR
ncbi:hypothetical protein MCOR02_006144 [Pyricularia oryzae]|uniref:Uncharacterized protein n=3 Tax=Pyricularia TaxID=48558 RepID=A0ABQ8ND31_PYRGI|nr:hypothetical protein MCOR01_007288 [Pyricularia oryzae]KAI6295100.1 hypothetical protein MCOR33_007927 [Pyricularia grisea]KAH9434120.1 hypothetical protein MCOR02_006144 [Pyricularia oryzae]KAI6261645.1 hypothetical protein MCOR19_002094 [Pyricularia oryzae]KAI6326007.1 hypothetical protein MCOR30_006603 [Pyricularia oryzae]